MSTYRRWENSQRKNSSSYFIISKLTANESNDKILDQECCICSVFNALAMLVTHSLTNNLFKSVVVNLCHKYRCRYTLIHMSVKLVSLDAWERNIKKRINIYNSSHIRFNWFTHIPFYSSWQIQNVSVWVITIYTYIQLNFWTKNSNHKISS